MELRLLWDEFEECSSIEARYAAALDRLQPLLLNYQSQGRSWKMHGITLRQVLERCSAIREGAPELWPPALKIINRAVEQGYIKR
jgi:putative hydrolase of HD superfamily